MIYSTINDEYHFWNWLKQSDNYSNNFSLEGAKAVQAYFEEYSEETDQNIEFDPIAWCCEFTEFDSIDKAWAEYGDPLDDCDDELDKQATLDWFRDQTTVIELDNGHIILGEF